MGLALSRVGCSNENVNLCRAVAATRNYAVAVTMDGEVYGMR